MINLPKRSDSIYKEIESFKDYEFTNCIAYEMAIRNDEVINKVKNFNSFNFEDFKKAHIELKEDFFLNKEIIFGLDYHKKSLKGLRILGDIENGVKDLLVFLQSEELLVKGEEYDKYIKKEIEELSIDELLNYNDFIIFYGYLNNNKYSCSVYNELDLSVIPKEFLLNKKKDFLENAKIENNILSRMPLHIPKQLI
jgi:hypothetical protein